MHRWKEEWEKREGGCACRVVKKTSARGKRCGDERRVERERELRGVSGSAQNGRAGWKTKRRSIASPVKRVVKYRTLRCYSHFFVFDHICNAMESSVCRGESTQDIEQKERTSGGTVG